MISRLPVTENLPVAKNQQKRNKFILWIHIEDDKRWAITYRSRLGADRSGEVNHCRRSHSKANHLSPRNRLPYRFPIRPPSSDHFSKGAPTLMALGTVDPLGFKKSIDFQWAVGPCPRRPNTRALTPFIPKPFPFLFLKSQILSKGSCSTKSQPSSLLPFKLRRSGIEGRCGSKLPPSQTLNQP